MGSLVQASNNIKPILNQEILIDPSLNAILSREKESIERQGVNINPENLTITE